MMTLRSVALAFVVTIVAVLGAGNAVFAQSSTPTDRTFYLRNDGGNCDAASHSYLGDTPGQADQRCGYPGGLPMGEAYDTINEDIARTYTTATAFNLTLDATRDLNGRITVAPYVDSDNETGTGVGQIVLEVYGTGQTATGTTVALGSSRVTAIATPLQSSQSILYAMLIPDELDGTALRQVTLRVKVRGAHILHGYTELNGASHVNVPFHTAFAAAAQPQPSPTP